MIEPEILVLGALAGGGWFWFDTMRAREAALRAGKAACARESVQFLDETVSLRGLGLGRDRAGRLRIRRRYVFEFSDTGDNRLSGRIVLLGQRVELLQMDAQTFYGSAGMEAP